MKFLKKFDKEFYNLLNGSPSNKKKSMYPNIFQRAEPFRLIFSMLEEKNKTFYNIVETGVLRKLDNWNDGQSSFLFQNFLKCSNGFLKSVDINPETCNNARQILDEKYSNVTCSDSLKFLSSIDVSTIDLFFLDSYDVDFRNDEDSANHHLNEFKIIETNLSKDTIIAIDDNTFYNGIRSGKGRKIFEYLQEKNINPIYDGYIIVYKWGSI